LRRPEFIARQSACPSGRLGSLIGWIMARETARANAFALDLLELSPTDRVLEVGFGHGATVARIAAVVAEGFTAGIDPSEQMCRAALRRNRGGIDRGIVKLRRGRAEGLPYADRAFDKILTVHTLYFWPDLLRPLAEMGRVLACGGRLVVGYRSDSSAPQSFPDSVYHFRDEVQVVDALRAVGFSDPRTYQQKAGGAVMSFTVALRPEESGA
jgi:ubiquinone/menaquinone biosynthesis C-methylase UbiE